MTGTSKRLTVLVTAAVLGLAAIAAAQPAEARGSHHHHGRVIFVGAPFAAATYYAADPLYYGNCYWTHLRVWNGFAWRLRRVHVCG